MKYILKTTIIALISCAFIPSIASEEAKGGNADRCYALAMSGGGALGAYEAGALWGLYNNIKDKSSMAYDVVTGVSAGSINTGAVIVFAKGDEANMVEFLSNAW